MRRLAGLIVVVTACTGHAGDDLGEARAPEELEMVEPEPGPDPGAGAVTHDGLELRLEYDGKRRLEPGESFTPRWSLHNSASAPRSFVHPGDGSAVGWREPHVYYTAQVSADGETWFEVEKGDLGRCGLYDHDWHDEIASLDPGETVELEWLPQPSWQLRLQRPGQVRLWAHYEFSAGAGFGSSRGVTDELGEMTGVPAFHLVSAPIEIEIVRPLDLVLHPKPINGPVRRLSQLVDLSLENHGVAARTVPAPGAAQVDVRVRSGDEERRLFDPDWEAHQRTGTVELESEASIDLLGPYLDFEVPADLALDELEVDVSLRFEHPRGHLETGWVRLDGGS
jgi:hypothetical protein